MIKKLSGDEKINILLICLESLDLYSIDNIYQSTIKNLYKTQKMLYIYKKYSSRSQSNYSIQKTLYLLHSINNIALENHLQEKIKIILSDYSSFYLTNTKNFSLITSQYLNRFIYKYQIFYRYKLTQKMNNQKKRKNRLYNLAIINLYILNKILSKDGPYILYKYLELNKYNLKTNFC
uniref:hypothetical protein n=1 Tax=Phymatolithon calcareum TaxID=1277942 RepID=UPI0023F09AED|nr:hypothetical protein P6G74_pgp189 [Phymatolithon calcareum]WEA76798.1 hypothetical protein [Phymatolithon calcareum]